jgi:hypothetical protein
VELLSENLSMSFIGVSRPNLDPTGDYHGSRCTDSWFINGSNGSLYRRRPTGDYECTHYVNSTHGDNGAGGYKQGDRVGMLLDLDIGSLCFFKNGVQHGLGYSAGSVTGPVVAAVQMRYKNQSVRMLPNAEAPAGV